MLVDGHDGRGRRVLRRARRPVVAEVEFDDEDAARAFTPPPWFGREVTGERGYANRSLSVHGLPAQEPA